MANEDKRVARPPSLSPLPVSPMSLKKAKGANKEELKPASIGGFTPLPPWGPKTPRNSVSAASASFKTPDRPIPNPGAASPTPPKTPPSKPPSTTTPTGSPKLPSTSKKPLFSDTSSSPPKAPKESIFNSPRFSSQPSSSSPKSTASTSHSRNNSNISPKTPRFATAHAGPSASATPVVGSGSEKNQPSPTKSILKNPSVSSTSPRANSKKEPPIPIGLPPNVDTQETGSNLCRENKLSGTKVEPPDWFTNVAGWLQKNVFGFDAELASREAAKLVEGLPDPVSRTHSRTTYQSSSSFTSAASSFSSHSSVEGGNGTITPTESPGNASTGQKLRANSYLSGAPVYYLREHVEKMYMMIVLKSQEVWWWGWAMGILTVLFLIELTGLLYNGNILSFAVLIEIWLLGWWIARGAHFPWYKYGITELEGRQAVQNGTKIARDWWGIPRVPTTVELQVPGAYAQSQPWSADLQQPRRPESVGGTPSVYPKGTEPVPQENTEVKHRQFASQGDVAAEASQPIFPLSSAARLRRRTEGAWGGGGMQRFPGSRDNQGVTFSPGEGPRSTWRSREQQRVSPSLGG